MYFWCLQFPPKNEQKQVNLRFHSSKVEFFRSFFVGNVGLKKSFRLCLAFKIRQNFYLATPIYIDISNFQDAGSQQIGFLLGSCSVAVALTSEMCYKSLPKTTTGEVVAFKGWPRLYWFLAEHLPKPPKDWMPPPRSQLLQIAKTHQKI